jgi:hypothetical protein
MDSAETPRPLGSSRTNQWRVSRKTVSLVREPLAPRPITIDTGGRALTLDLARTAIVVIDMPRPGSGARVLEAGSWSASIVDGLAARSDDIRLSKYRMSGFADTALDSILRNLNVTTLLFGGVNMDQCVLCTLQDAHFLGYDCLLLEDCSATTSPRFCVDATLYNVRQCFGFVTDSEAITAALPRDAEGSAA